VKIISSQLSSLLPPSDSSLSGAASTRVAAQDLDISAEDAVQVSRLGTLADSADAADVDLEKVAALRQAIGDGSFQADTAAIYDGLVASAREMLGSDGE
jgi:flagellar biosynthesis anti-sigma factor FlgM